MPETPPINLLTNGRAPNHEFDEEEVLYRRYMGNHPVEFFSEIRTKDFSAGISTNRSKYSVPLDVLWSSELENGECQFNLKSGKIVYGTISVINCVNESLGIEIRCIHTPTFCNYSHVDIRFFPNVIECNSEGIPILRNNNKVIYANGFNKQSIRDIRLFVASFFKIYF